MNLAMEEEGFGASEVRLGEQCRAPEEPESEEAEKVEVERCARRRCRRRRHLRCCSAGDGSHRRLRPPSGSRLFRSPSRERR